MGAHIPVWDIADHFGEQTNLLVTNMPQGCDLERGLGSHSVALMRGHGVAAAAPSPIEVVRTAVPRNARALMAAMRLGGEVKSLSQGEIAARAAGADQPPTCDGAEERQRTVVPPTAAGCGSARHAVGITAFPPLHSTGAPTMPSASAPGFPTPAPAG
jgi:hypothetical protein